MLPDALPNSPKAICHERGGAEDVNSGPEAASREVSLVLDGAVAARRRHILRHLEGVGRRINSFVGVVMRKRAVGAAGDARTAGVGLGGYVRALFSGR